MKLVISADKIEYDNTTGQILVRCSHCRRMAPVEIRQMQDNEIQLRNQPWCSKCRRESAELARSYHASC